MKKNKKIIASMFAAASFGSASPKTFAKSDTSYYIALGAMSIGIIGAGVCQGL